MFNFKESWEKMKGTWANKWKSSPDQTYYQKNPTAPRSAEVSQNQDSLASTKSRSPERKAFDKKIEIQNQT